MEGSGITCHHCLQDFPSPLAATHHQLLCKRFVCLDESCGYVCNKKSRLIRHLEDTKKGWSCLGSYAGDRLNALDANKLWRATALQNIQYESSSDSSNQGHEDCGNTDLSPSPPGLAGKETCGAGTGKGGGPETHHLKPHSSVFAGASGAVNPGSCLSPELHSWQGMFLECSQL